MSKKPLTARKIFSLAVVLSLVAVFFSPVSSAQAAAPSREDCVPAVLMLRGSDEQRLKEEDREYFNPGESYLDEDHLFIKTEGYEGATLNRLLTAFVAQTDPLETVSKVRFIDIDYDAAAVFPEVHTNNPVEVASIWLAHLLTYNNSYRGGAENVVNFIQSDINERQCDTRYMIVGYSQGVISARLALNLLDNNRDKIISTYVIGDPFQASFAATSPRQKSPANTSADSPGVGVVVPGLLNAISPIILGAQNQPMLASAQASLATFSAEFQMSNDIIYRDDEDEGIVSRALCHAYDPTCGFNLIENSIDPHMNYFLPGDVRGAVDISHEVEEFDNQIKVLANSIPSQQKPRTLKSTPPINGEPGSYNIANTQYGDRCSWDDNSDGTLDVYNQPCTVHTFTPDSGAEANITAYVEDSFGSMYTFTESKPALDKGNIEAITHLETDNWYQFHPYGQTNNCISIVHDSQEPLYYVEGVSIEPCGTPTPSGLTQRIESSKQVFKSAKNNALKWGYDDNFSLRTGNDYRSYDEEGNWSPHLGPNHGDIVLSKYGYRKFEIVLAKIENGVPYYKFREDGRCVFLTSSQKLKLDITENGQKCSGSSNELFSVTKAIGEFGNLSLEQDLVSPTSVTGLEASDIHKNSVTLSWDSSTDIRDHNLSYAVFSSQFSNSRPYITTKNLSVVITLPDSGAEGTTYTVHSQDLAGNNGRIPATITLGELEPTVIPKPTTPTLGDISEDFSSVTINLPSGADLLVDSVDVYRNNIYLASTTGNSFTDSAIHRGEQYEYTYKVINNYGESSEMSDPLLVSTINTTPPSTATNLVATANYDGTEVKITFTPGNDDLGDELTYSLFRNGMEIPSNNISTNELSDPHPLPGYNSYTIVAKDWDGNFSAFSEPVTVNVIIPDTIAPTKPILHVTETTENSVHFTIESFDNGSSPYYYIYRDGNLIQSTEETFMLDTLSSGTSYEYTVIAVDQAGNYSETSDGLTVTTLEADNETPTKPTIGLVQLSETSVGITITSTDNRLITNYKIYRNGGLVSSQYQNVYYDYGLSPSTIYEYTVKATDAAGNISPVSETFIVTTHEQEANEDTEAPTKPILSLLAVSSTSADLSIDSVDNVPGILTYNVYRNGIWIGDSSSDNNIFYDTNLQPGTTYEYSVVAIDAAGNNSETSDILTVTTENDSPPTITIPTVTDLSIIYSAPTVAYVGWGVPPGPGGYYYDVYRDGVFLQTTWEPNFVDNTTQPETTYAYTVIVKHWQGGQSDPSTPLVVTTPPVSVGPDSIAPSGFTLSPWGMGNGQTISLNWSQSVDDTSPVTYQVYRDEELVTVTSERYIYYTDVNLTVNTQVTYTVKAIDTAGNQTTGTGSFTYTWDGSTGPSCAPNCGGMG